MSGEEVEAVYGPEHLPDREAIGEDPDWLIDRYADMMGEAIAERPDDLVVAMHMCRGNVQSTHAASGAYDPAAEAIFNRTGVDIFFMEYDTDRAGGLVVRDVGARGMRHDADPGHLRGDQDERRDPRRVREGL